MAAPPCTVALYILARLKQAGLGHMFAVPGDYAGPFLEALDADPDIVRVPTINELGCGYAADGYARFTGIGAACVQYGVGGFSALELRGRLLGRAGAGGDHLGEPGDRRPPARAPAADPLPPFDRRPRGRSQRL